MTKNSLNLLQGFAQNSLLKLAIVIVAIASIGLSTVSHYGISSDERTEIRIVQENIDLITKDDPIQGDIVYYGVLFNFLSEGIFRVEEYARYGSVEHPLDCQGDDLCLRSSMRERIRVKHIVNFLFSAIGYFAIAGIVSILCGWEYAWFGLIVLALFPQFWGHSFFNPKDIPFAVMFLLCTYVGSYVIDRYLNVEDRIKVGRNPMTLIFLGYGVLVGLLTATRIGGFLMLFFVAIAYFLLKLNQGNPFKEFYKVLNGCLLMGVAWFVTVIILHPASWSNPPLWFFRAVKYLARHSWDKNILFNGEYIRATKLPWFYLPTWATITTPVIFLLAFAMGLVFICLKFSKFSNLQRACIILILLQIFFLPLIAMVGGSTIYDGFRQFLFVIPGMAAIATAGLIWSYQKLRKKNLKIFAIALIFCLFIPIVLDMVALHPYEYIYFNRAFGGLQQANNRYETDYWGLSVQDAVEWFNQTAEPNAKLVVGTPFNSTLIASDPDVNVVELDYDYKKMKIAKEQKPIVKPYYFLAIPKHGLNRVFTDCKLVYQVERQQVPLTTIRKCE